MEVTYSWQWQNSSWKQKHAGRVIETEALDPGLVVYAKVPALKVEVGGPQVPGQHGLCDIKPCHIVAQTKIKLRGKKGKEKENPLPWHGSTHF